MESSPVRSTALVPSEALRRYVRRFVVIENFADRVNTLLPDIAIVAGFRFQGECSQDGTSALRSVVTGLRDRARVLSHSRGSGTIVAMFTSLGAAAFVREPLEHLFNATLPIEEQVKRSQLDLLEEQLVEASEHTLRVAALEQFLLRHLRAQQPDFAVAFAVDRIRRTRGTMRISELAREAGLSQSALERRFRRGVGASPKKYAAIVRLRHAVKLHASGASLTEIAHAAGYADQPHFNKDFKRLSGESPEAFFRNPSAYC
jgi:AraC-like DNA-binding protein